MKQKLIKFTRVVGFYRPTTSFNEGKKKEFKQRKSYDLKRYEYRDR